MSPYVLLRDEARVQKISRSPSPAWKPPQNTSVSEPMWTSAPDFLSYVDEILEQRARGNSLQPPDTPAEKREMRNASNTTSLSSMDLTLDPSSEKQRPEHLLPQPPSNPVAASFGIPRPSNSQSSHPSTFLASLQSNVVLRRYGLANAETGLASDYPSART